MPEPTKYKVNGQEIAVSVKGKEEYDLPWGGKLQYYNSIVGGAIDARFMPAILKGIMEKMDEGPLTGSYARDIRVVQTSLRSSLQVVTPSRLRSAMLVQRLWSLSTT